MGAVTVVTAHALDALVEKPEGRPAPIEIGISLLILALAAIAVGAFRRAGGPARGGLALLVGTGAVIEGAGVTGAHIFREAPSGADYTGLLSLVAGLVLLGLGGVLVVRRVPGWWRLLALPAAVVLLLYVVTPLAMAVVITHPPAKAVSAGTPGDVGLAYRDVTVQTDDGVTLAGWYVPSRNRAAVVAIPGAWSTRSDVFDQMVVLARHGYGVLDLDPRGHGDSQGTAMDMGWFGESDVTAAVSFLSRQPDVDASRIGALGLSMGGEEALTAAAVDSRIGAVVSEGGTNRTFDDMRPVAGDEWLVLPTLWVVTQAADLLSPAAPPMPLADAVARIAPRPVLLISASQEPELTLTRHLQEAAPQTTTLWEPAATAHTQGLATHPAEWSSRVLDFLDGALLGRR